MNYLQTGKRNRSIRTGWERMRCAGKTLTWREKASKTRMFIQEQYGEVGSEFHRTLKGRSVGMGPCILINRIGKFHL